MKCDKNSLSWESPHKMTGIDFDLVIFCGVKNIKGPQLKFSVYKHNFRVTVIIFTSFSTEFT